MPQTRTAKKNLRKSRRRREANRSALSTMRTQVKKVRTALAAGDAGTAQAQLARTQKLLDKNAKSNRIHPKKASRLKSRLARAVARKKAG